MKQVTLFKVVTEKVMVQDLRDHHTFINPDRVSYVVRTSEIVHDLTFTETLPINRLNINGVEKYVIVSPEAQEILRLTEEETLFRDVQVADWKKQVIQSNKLKSIAQTRQRILRDQIQKDNKTLFNSTWWTRLRWVFTGVRLA